MQHNFSRCRIVHCLECEQQWEDYANDNGLCFHCGLHWTHLGLKYPVNCYCHKLGYSGHELRAWCSWDCMVDSHPEPDVDTIAEAQAERNEEAK